MGKIIITVLGHDRPGIVASISRLLFKHNCNIENLSQTILQSEFAGIFIISVPDELTCKTLENNLQTELASSGLNINIRKLEQKNYKFPPIASDTFIITTFGPDKKGLVSKITNILAEYKVNITNLRAVFKGGDDPNDNIMFYEVDMPKDADHNKLYNDLKETAKELKLEINIQHNNIFKAINKI